MFENEEVKIIEIAPRCGGNFLSDAIEESYGVDLKEALILFSIHGPEYLRSYDFETKKQKNVYNLMLTAPHSGYYAGLNVPDTKLTKLMENIWTNIGDPISKFGEGGQYLGRVLFSAKNIQDINIFDKKILKNEHVLVKEN